MPPRLSFNSQLTSSVNAPWVRLLCNCFPLELPLFQLVHCRPLRQVPFPQTPATAFVEYEGSSHIHPVYMPTFPAHNDSSYRDFWDSQERSLNTSDQTLYVPQTIDRELFFTVGYGLSSNSSCSPLPNCTAGFEGYRILGAVNNITFVTPSSSDTSLLQYAYLYDRGVSTSNSNFDLSFPDDPESTFNYTGPQPPLSTRFPEHATRLSHIDYNSNVQALLLFFFIFFSPLLLQIPGAICRERELESFYSWQTCYYRWRDSSIRSIDYNSNVQALVLLSIAGTSRSNLSGKGSTIIL